MKFGSVVNVSGTEVIVSSSIHLHFRLTNNDETIHYIPIEYSYVRDSTNQFVLDNLGKNIRDDSISYTPAYYNAALDNNSVYGNPVWGSLNERGVSIMSNIKEVYAMINGVKRVATYDAANRVYVVTADAPSESSWSQPNHVYGVTLHATDEANNIAQIGPDDPTYGQKLKIRVLEKTAPTATITSPTSGSVLGSATQTITFKLKDAGGSGLNTSSVNLVVNNKKVTSGISYSSPESDGTVTGTYNATGLSDGQNTVSVAVTDNDGNKSATATVQFVISTAAPLLNVTSPADNIWTNSRKVTVAGTAAPGSNAVTLSAVTINGSPVAVTSGSFSKEIDLVEGANTIRVVATDSLGKTTTVVRTVNLDTKAPIITDVVTEATTVDAGGRIKITFKVTDAPAASE